MATKTFMVGKVMIGGTQVGGLSNAGLTITLNSGDVSTIGTSWRKLIALGRQATLTLTMDHDPVDTAQAALRTEHLSGDGLVTTVRMYTDASHYFSCTEALLTSFGPTKARGAVDQLTATLEMNSSLAYT